MEVIMKRFYRALLSSAATLVGSPAIAGDLEVPPAYVQPGYPSPVAAPAVTAPVPYVPRWYGPYGGLNLGFAWGDLDGFSINPTGVIAGGQVGYNWQNGQFVFGGESDLQLSSTDATFASYQFSNPWFGTVRGRAGFAWGWALFYATAGVAFGEGKLDFGNNLSETNTNLGWTAGAGIEFAFTPCWSIKAEYLFYDLGTQNFQQAGINTGFSAEVLRLGVNYRFCGFWRRKYNQQGPVSKMMSATLRGHP
jgi:outer membrane immunogenic protein